MTDERDRTDLDTGAKPGHAMLPDMGFYRFDAHPV